MTDQVLKPRWDKATLEKIFHFPGIISSESVFVEGVEQLDEKHLRIARALGAFIPFTELATKFRDLRSVAPAAVIPVAETVLKILECYRTLLGRLPLSADTSNTVLPSQWLNSVLMFLYNKHSDSLVKGGDGRILVNYNVVAFVYTK